MKHFSFKVTIKFSTIGWFISYLLSVLLVGMFASDLSKDFSLGYPLHSTLLDGFGLAISILSVSSDIQHLIED